jgi:alpha-N-arabinofuranosidase
MKTRITVDADHPIARINPNIYGHFAEHLGGCIYDGIWVGPGSSIPNRRGIRIDVIEALRRIKPPVLRWPGGCFADDYHWRDGVGPRESRPRRINAHWGGVVEDNAFGTHEFVDFCRQIGAEPYVCGNVGSGTVREMRDWLEYLNCDGDSTLTRLRAANGHPGPFGVRYFGVGNENWGCGGAMTPEYYADQVRRYSSFLFFGDHLCRIACGPAGTNLSWTRRFFQALGGDDPAFRRLGLIQGFGAHYYCGTAGTATEYSDDQWYELLGKAQVMEDVVVRNRAIMDGFDPERRIGLAVDEWGTWHPPMQGTNPRFLRQQNTIRDALVAALSLDILNRHADKVVMANIAQLVNVLQSLILTEGPNMLLTPTYHVYEMYSPHQGAHSLPCRVDTDSLEFRRPGADGKGSVPRVAGSASRMETSINLSLVNTHTCEPADVEIEMRGVRKADMVSWRVLGADDIHEHNTFDDPHRVAPKDEDTSAGGLSLRPASVNILTFRVV